MMCEVLSRMDHQLWRRVTQQLFALPPSPPPPNYFFFVKGENKNNMIYNSDMII
ncbi:hypothetical protein M0804_012503 [Polistes exclamans]|nr:hypothetical protein M0804_012503 [Polistes exclamans]